MLKISWSMELESSTTRTISVCGLKYVPGRSSMSSTSMMRVSMSAIARDPIYPCRAAARTAGDHRGHQLASERDGSSPESPSLLAQILELAELALDLLLDIERLLSLPDPTLVPSDHELSHLFHEPVIDARGL